VKEFTVTRHMENWTGGAHQETIKASSRRQAVVKYIQKYCGSLGMLQGVAFVNRANGCSNWKAFGTTGRVEFFTTN